MVITIIILSFKFKLSLVSFLLFLCILAVSVLWLTVIISLFYIVLIFFDFGYIFQLTIMRFIQREIKFDQGQN